MRKIKQIIRYMRNKLVSQYKRQIIREIGGGNNLLISNDLCYDKLHIIVRGRNNTIQVGRNCRFGGENWIFMSGDNNKLSIGNNVTFDDDVHFILAEGTQIRVGDDCMFAKHINLRTSDQHAIYDANGTRVNTAKNINVGDHVWIGASVIVMKGVNIGSGAVVGINTMVTKDIPAKCVAAGTPARVLKENMRWTREL